MALVVDRAWADGVGWSYRPWEPTDADRDYEISELTVLNTANDKAIYIPLASEYQYLRDKGVKSVADKVAYPTGYGMAFKSVKILKCVVDGVARKDNDKIQGAHTDGIYINGDKAVLNKKTDLLIEDFVARNCDGSCMPIIIQDPSRIGTCILRRVIFEDTVVQKRLNLKRGIVIDKLLFENCGSIVVTPDDATVSVGRIDIVNSPGINLKQFFPICTNTVVVIDGKQVAGPVAQPPVVVETPPVIAPPVVVQPVVPVKLTITYSDNTTKDISL
jgi:hypothetical protein